MLTRVFAISDPNEARDPSYLEGLSGAVGAALEYGIDGIEHGEGHPPSIPAALLDQARLAARGGIDLDVVLRRYFAGYTLLSDFMLEEARESGLLATAAFKRVLRSQAILLDRLFATVAETYAREAESRPRGAEQRRVEHVKHLLAGELLDLSEFAYEFNGFHLGVIAVGPDASEAMTRVVRGVDCRHLLVRPERNTVWAWFGSRRRIDAADLTPHIPALQSPIAIAIGNAGKDLSGWRLTHRQASAALPIASRFPTRSTCYADVALLASVIKDDLLVTSLRQLYIIPLEAERDKGKVARETLRAFFAADRNVSSAAAALGVTRQTVNNRLHSIEQILGHRLTAHATEIEAALRLEEYRE